MAGEKKNLYNNYSISHSLERRGLQRFNLFFLFSCASCNCPCLFVLRGGGMCVLALEKKKNKTIRRSKEFLLDISGLYLPSSLASEDIQLAV